MLIHRRNPIFSTNQTTCYTIMRKALSSFVLLLLAAPSVWGQTSPESPAPDPAPAKVIFMRATGHVGSATAFNAFIDDNMVCRLNNKRFSTHLVQPGEHYFSVQFAGKDSKVKAERIAINTEPGKTYYVQMILQQTFMTANIFCQEVTQNSANLLLPKMKEDTKCL